MITLIPSADQSQHDALSVNGISMGDWVIYRKPKASRAPGPRARGVAPSRFGEDYRYYVEKYWIVVGIEPDGRLLVRTRRGKHHVLSPDDLNLRRARWWERMLYRGRFRKVEEEIQAGVTEAAPHQPGVGQSENGQPLS